MAETATERMDIHARVSDRGRLVLVILIIAAAVLLLPVSSPHAEIYQWTDAQGNTVYSDSPPAGVDAKQKKVRTDRIEKPAAKYQESWPLKSTKEAPKKRDLGDITVILYAADW